MILQVAGRVLSTKVDKLLELDATAQNITEKKSRGPHSDAGLGLFASRTIVRGRTAEFYYVSLVNSNLTKEQQITKKDRKGVMYITAETIRELAKELAETITHNDRLQ